jgi:hypothetical protein
VLTRLLKTGRRGVGGAGNVSKFVDTEYPCTYRQVSICA